jgi:energy-converting hydrogenase Eha subunit G
MSSAMSSVMAVVVGFTMRAVCMAVAGFFTFFAYKRQHEPGMRFWGSFWLALFVDSCLSLIGETVSKGVRRGVSKGVEDGRSSGCLPGQTVRP